MTHDEALQWVSNNIDIKFKSINQWHEYIRKNELPEFIPKRPEFSYKNKGWKGPAHFFGYDNSRRERLTKDNSFTYDQAKNFVSNFNLNSKGAWIKFSQNNSKDENIFPKKLPTNPDVFYKNDGWISWEDFLGIDDSNSTNKRIVY